MRARAASAGAGVPVLVRPGPGQALQCRWPTACSALLCSTLVEKNNKLGGNLVRAGVWTHAMARGDAAWQKHRLRTYMAGDTGPQGFVAYPRGQPAAQGLQAQIFTNHGELFAINKYGEIAIFILKLSLEVQIGPSTFKTFNLVPKQSIFSQSHLLLLTNRHVSRESCQKSFLPLPPSFMSHIMHLKEKNYEHVRCIQRKKL